MRYAALLLAVLAITGPARADDITDAVAAIPGQIEELRLVGSWNEGSKQGAYRVVHVRTGANFTASRLFVQWLAMTGSTIELEHSIEIKELGELSTGVLDYFAESDDEGLSMFIETHNEATGEDQTYELFLFGRDDYRFGPATN